MKTHRTGNSFYCLDLESTAVVEDNLANQFQRLNVIDATEQKTVPTKPGIFSKDKLSAAMMKNVDDDC